MPVKFWQMIVRFWFFLSYLITYYCIKMLLQKGLQPHCVVDTQRVYIGQAKDIIRYGRNTSFNLILWNYTYSKLSIKRTGRLST